MEYEEVVMVPHPINSWNNDKDIAESFGNIRGLPLKVSMKESIKSLQYDVSTATKDPVNGASESSDSSSSLSAFRVFQPSGGDRLCDLDHSKRSTADFMTTTSTTSSSSRMRNYSLFDSAQQHMSSKRCPKTIADSLPMNLSMKSNGKSKGEFDAGKTVARLLQGGKTHMGDLSSSDDQHSSGSRSQVSSVFFSSENESQSGSDHSSMSRKRRKQILVPDSDKDERYWARRLKNNEAAKRSRDMRIHREKVIFEENSRLERICQDLKDKVDNIATENKELHLKLDIVMEENSRLKSLLLSYQTREVEKRQFSSSKSDSDLNFGQARTDALMSDTRKVFPFSDGFKGSWGEKRSRSQLNS